MYCHRPGFGEAEIHLLLLMIIIIIIRFVMQCVKVYATLSQSETTTLTI